MYFVKFCTGPYFVTEAKSSFLDFVSTGNIITPIDHDKV